MYKQLGRNTVVLLGVGHTNAHVLRMWKMKPPRNAQLVCVSNFPMATYSGMMPGVMAGQYPVESMEIDLVRFCNSAGARLVIGDVNGLDTTKKELHFSDRPPLSYELLSIGVGSVPSTASVNVEDEQQLIAIKPMQTFLKRLQKRLESVADLDRPPRVVVVGGGLGSIEIAFCLEHRLKSDPEWSQKFKIAPQISLVTGGKRVGAGLLPSTAERVEQRLRDRGIEFVTGSRVAAIHADSLKLTDDRTVPADVVIWATSAVASSLLEKLNLEKDGKGFVLTNALLQSKTSKNVFAVGDSGTIEGMDLPKAGVYAVRQGPILWKNIQRHFKGQPSVPYRPQSGFLKLINEGNGRGIAEYMGRTFEGPFWWRMKDRIDVKFMKMYQDYRLMEMKPDSGEDQPEMRCLGCGGKIGGELLSAVIDELTIPKHPDVIIGLDNPDDAAIIRTHNNQVTVTTDFFAAPFDDPYLVGRIATLNSASDCFVMGAQPTSALAIVQIPMGHPRAQMQVMRELMAGSVEELNRMGAALVGGHSIEGPRTTIGFTILGRQLPEIESATTKGQLAVGDQLVLTKSLGTGILLVALMQSKLLGHAYPPLMESMLQSNQIALELAKRYPVSAMTDVTGFGFVGHLGEMLRASKVSAKIDLASIPLLPGCQGLVEQGIQSTLAPDNRVLVNKLDFQSSHDVGSNELAPLFDPQTGGGLLFGMSAGQVEEVTQFLKDAGFAETTVVGEVTKLAPELSELVLD